MRAVAGTSLAGTPLGEFEQRGAEYGAELAAALALAGTRADGDRAIVNEMAKVAVHEINAAVEWLRQGDLPESLVSNYERACRTGFRDELLRLTGRVHADTTQPGQIAA